MASYKIEWKRSATKELKTLPPEIIKKILVAVEALAETHCRMGLKTSLALITPTAFAKEHIGIYNLLSDVVVIEIIKVGHRKNVYR